MTADGVELLGGAGNGSCSILKQLIIWTQVSGAAKTHRVKTVMIYAYRWRMVGPHHTTGCVEHQFCAGLRSDIVTGCPCRFNKRAGLCVIKGIAAAQYCKVVLTGCSWAVSGVAEWASGGSRLR